MSHKSTDDKSNPWVTYAEYAVAAPGKDEILDFENVSVKAIDEFVAQGVLTPEEVYEAENKTENPRVSVLRKYAPKKDDEKAEDKNEK